MYALVLLATRGRLREEEKLFRWQFPLENLKKS